MDASTTTFIDELCATAREIPTARIVLPWRGEFGIICNWHGPQINAVASPKIIPIEPGMEALYPDAARYVYAPVCPDHQKGYLQETDAKLQKAVAANIPHRHLVWPNEEAHRKWFVPDAFVPVAAPATDVVICPRQRETGCGRNWQHWQTLLDGLRLDDLSVAAAGSPWSSVDVHGCGFRAWEHDRCLDASISLMKKTKLVVGTDTGLTHLALMCGVPAILLISSDTGRVADGCYTSPTHGKTRYWFILSREYYEEPNHADSYVGMMYHAWEDPQLVRRHVQNLLNNYDAKITNRILRPPAERHVVRLGDSESSGE
jgi:hypothetical protein